MDMPVIDLSREADPGAAAKAWMSDDLARLFDLTRGPLLRFALVKAADDRFFWYGAYHHLVNDFSGSLLIERRVADLYSQLVGGAEPEWRNPAHGSTFWMKTKATGSLPAFAEIKTIGASASSTGPMWRRFQAWLPASAASVVRSGGYIPRPFVNQLEQLAAANGASLAAAIVAAAAIYLYRVTGERDQILGMPVSARTSAMLRRVVGPAMNVVPLRIAIDPAELTLDVVRQAGRRMREAMRHQRYWAGARRRNFALARISAIFTARP